MVAVSYLLFIILFLFLCISLTTLELLSISYFSDIENSFLFFISQIRDMI